MIYKESKRPLRYEAPDISEIRVDVSSPLLQSFTIQDVEEENLGW